MEGECLVFTSVKGVHIVARWEGAVLGIRVLLASP